MLQQNINIRLGNKMTARLTWTLMDITDLNSDKVENLLIVILHYNFKITKHIGR